MKDTLIAFFLFTSTLFAQDREMLRHFDYDQKAPLDVQEVGVERRGGVTIHDISYASPKGGRVCRVEKDRSRLSSGDTGICRARNS